VKCLAGLKCSKSFQKHTLIPWTLLTFSNTLSGYHSSFSPRLCHVPCPPGATLVSWWGVWLSAGTSSQPPTETSTCGPSPVLWGPTWASSQFQAGKARVDLL
jgi:hypothetical protein